MMPARMSAQHLAVFYLTDPVQERQKATQPQAVQSGFQYAGHYVGSGEIFVFSVTDAIGKPPGVADGLYDVCTALVRRPEELA